MKIPIRDTVAEMIQKCINTALEKSTEVNNPKKYLFNEYEGKLRTYPIPKDRLLNAIKRLIKAKNILDENGELFHFKMHSLRHTRAKEYVEQGINICIIQQILGHRSLQMTMHYAKVSENTLYETWKKTSDLDLFNISSESTDKEKNIRTEEKTIRYEYIKQNLDAVKVPFGICFKPSKIACKGQLNSCLTCSSFCSTTENITEYEDEIKRVEAQIQISEDLDRQIWKEKNISYLELLKTMKNKVQEEKIVHKNCNSREEH